MRKITRDPEVMNETYKRKVQNRTVFSLSLPQSSWPVILVVGFTHSDRPASSRLKEKMYADLSGSSLADQIKRQPSKPIWLDEWFIRIARWELSSASTPETGGKKWNQYPNRVRRESAEKMCDARYARPPWFPNHYSRVLNVCSISSHCWKRPL